MKKIFAVILSILFCLCFFVGCDDGHDPDAPVSQTKKEKLVKELKGLANDAFALEADFVISSSEKSSERTDNRKSNGRITGMVSGNNADFLAAIDFSTDRSFDGGTFRESKQQYSLAFLRGRSLYTADGETEELFGAPRTLRGITLSDVLGAFRTGGKKLSRDTETETAGVGYLPPEVYANLVSLMDCTASATETGYALEFDLVGLAKSSLKALLSVLEELEPDTTLSSIFRNQTVSRLVEKALDGVTAKRLRSYLQRGTSAPLPLAENAETALAWAEKTLGDKEFFSRFNTADGTLYSMTAKTLGAVTVTELINESVSEQTNAWNYFDRADIAKLLRSLREGFSDLSEDFERTVLEAVFANMTEAEGNVLVPSLDLKLTAEFDSKGKVSDMGITGLVKGSLLFETYDEIETRLSLNAEFAAKISFPESVETADIDGLMESGGD